MIPNPYKLEIGAALVALILGFGYFLGYRHEHAAWAAATAKLEKAASIAIIARAAENAKKADQQAKDNAAITRAKDEELTAVRARLAAERMRKPAFCSGAPAATKADSASSSTPADSASGLLSVEVDGNIKALILETEEVAATARACQAFITKNGMVP